MLAGHVVHVEASLGDDAVGVIEFGRLGQMRDIAGVNDERWLHRQGFDFVDRFFERADGVGIGGLVETDMAVADLQESQAVWFRSPRLADNAHGTRYPAGDRP